MIYFTIYVLGGLVIVAVAVVGALLWVIWYLSGIPKQVNNVK